MLSHSIQWHAFKKQRQASPETVAHYVTILHDLTSNQIVMIKQTEWSMLIEHVSKPSIDQTRAENRQINNTCDTSGICCSTNKSYTALSTGLKNTRSTYAIMIPSHSGCNPNPNIWLIYLGALQPIKLISLGMKSDILPVWRSSKTSEMLLCLSSSSVTNHLPSMARNHKEKTPYIWLPTSESD